MPDIADQDRESLNKLSLDIAAAKLQLTGPPTGQIRPQASEPPVSPPAQGAKVGNKTGFTRFASRLRTSIRAKDRTDTRRFTNEGAPQLDVVVETEIPSPQPKRRNSLPTNELLAVLAPLIASLQRLGLSPDLESHGAGALELRLQYIDVCDEVRALLLDLQEQDDNEKDELEMRSLLLVALLKKVHAEKAKHRSPLACIEATDPFILHRNSNTRSSGGSGSTRRISVGSKAIAGPPSRGSVDSNESANEEYLRESKATWQMHVHKIASFQSSALFSNSPVAARKPLSISPLTKIP